MKTAIYGAGQAGRMCRMWLSKEHDVICYIDSDPRKQGTFIDGIPVVGPDDMPRTDIVWVAVINREAVTEIKRMLTQKGRAKEIRDITGLRQDFDLRLCSLRLLALSVKERNIGGSLAELGVYQGAFAAEISRLFPERKIVLFDTFAGFAEKDMEKEKEVSGQRRFRDFSDTGTEAVRQIMPYPENAVFVKGYFPDSVTGRDDLPDQYALVSLDPDLYAPALSGLEYFWPRMAKGGVIMIHDYTSMQFPGVKKAVDEFCAQNHLYPVPLMDLHGSAILTAQ